MKTSNHNVRSNHVDPYTYYDFYKEKFFTNVLGFYIILKSPVIVYILNRVCILCVAVLYTCGVTSAIYTMKFIAKDKSEMVQSFYAMGLMGVSIGFHAVKNSTTKSLDDATTFIRTGVYRYNEIFHKELMEIKGRRISRIRFLVKFVCSGMYFCAFANTTIPLIRLAFAGFDISHEGDVNPFLPFFLYVPFDTRNVRGYLAAYACNGIIMFTMYACFAAHAQLYISCSLQLTLELELLNHSLRNLEKRAYLRLKDSIPSSSQGSSSILQLYDTSQFQDYLYMSLRENIMHHQTILRFRDTITPYVQTTVTVVLLFFSLLMAAGILIILENSKPQLTLLTDIFGFLPLCWVGQAVMNESSETKNALFDTPWPYCNEKIKVLMKVFFSNVQKPIILRSRGFDIKLCLETFGDMVSVGYKITNVMR
nr:olfactory receptor 39 [Tropidothorax elegans]